MNNLQFLKVNSINDIKSLRSHYLNSLVEPQELFLELKVQSAEHYLIKESEFTLGYFSISDSEVLVELYIEDIHICKGELIIKRIVDQFSIQSALCKSFDQNLLNAAISIHKDISIVGINFRKLLNNYEISDLIDISVSIALPQDFKMIQSINEEVFETEEEINDYLKRKQILLFKKDEEIIGFGIFAPVIIGRDDYDIGMCVCKEYRRQGFGELIIRFLIEHCILNGWRPIAGCDIHNVASRKCLEKAGFIAHHRMLQINFH